MYHCLVILAKRHRMVKSNCQDFWKQICKCSSAFVIHNIPLTQHIQYAVHSVTSILLNYICRRSHFEKIFFFYVWFLHPFCQNQFKLQFRKDILSILKDALLGEVVYLCQGLRTKTDIISAVRECLLKLVEWKQARKQHLTRSVVQSEVCSTRNNLPGKTGPLALLTG